MHYIHVIICWFPDFVSGFVVVYHHLSILGYVSTVIIVCFAIPLLPMSAENLTLQPLPARRKCSKTRVKWKFLCGVKEDCPTVPSIPAFVLCPYSLLLWLYFRCLAPLAQEMSPSMTNGSANHGRKRLILISRSQPLRELLWFVSYVQCSFSVQRHYSMILFMHIVRSQSEGK